ncbi:unnamed protein product [Owenia fusiformis]|uniref:Uncharacterized protein n=1 Tax=Owenia fusiformis TaxID=6347 RepID=A0A8J1Y7J8_OWEFU|nr:unnamed protein product [Owenia fusiformis]
MLALTGFYIISVVFRVVISDYTLRDLQDDDAYVHQGDVMIGVLANILKSDSDQVGFCSGERGSRRLSAFKTIAVLKYAMDMVNDNSNLLPGVRLGYVALPTCSGGILQTLARALQFVPQTQEQTYPSLHNQHFYKVVGVFGPKASQPSVVVSPVLSLAQIPHISDVATSDELSNKDLYPYFMRVAPPDRYQTQAIVDILRYFKWTYVSTLHRPDSYGQNGINKVHRLLKMYDICLEYSGVIDSSMTQGEFDDVYKGLTRHNRPRVVIVFAMSADLKGVLRAIKRSNGSNEFIWVVSDGVNSVKDGMHQMVGSIKIELYSETDEAVETFIKSLNLNDFPTMHPSWQKWIEDEWENTFRCSFNTSIVNATRCRKDSRLYEAKRNLSYGKKASSLLDTINTFAHGLHELILNECPLAFNDTTLLDTCIKGPIFKWYLLNSNFTGNWGRIRFDTFGDILGRYLITQIQNDRQREGVVQIGMWDKQMQVNLKINDSNLKWHHHTDHNKLQNVYPESMCSYPCQPGEFYIKQELKCCWECRKCRTNEITTNNASTCKECPIYKWPDQLTFGYCVDIPSNYLQYKDSLAILMSTLTIFGLLICTITAILLITNRKHKLVKASNKELTSFILFGTMLAYMTVFMIISKPESMNCYLSCIGFHISSSLAYAPMVVKTNRVFRIFDGGKKMNRPRFMSSRWQVIFTAVLILIQIVVSVCLTAVLPPVVTRNQPVLTEKFVELLCWIPLESLIAPLVYNLVLIIICSYYGFKTRFLPDNFNESRFIFFSVSTTLFLWIAFLPTYFTASSAYHKATLLSALLILNASVTLLVLFLPKLYAIYYISEDHMKFTPSFLTVASMNQTPATNLSNVSPPPGPSRSGITLKPIGRPATIPSMEK